MIRDEVTKAAEPIAHLPTPASEGAEIGASEVALATPEAKPSAEPSTHPLSLDETGRTAKPDAAE